MTNLPPLGRYEIDVENSAIRFTTRHLYGLGRARGTFDVKGGTVDVAEPLADSRVRVEIDAAGFHTGNHRRDETVRSARFLDVARNPVITFTGGHTDGETLTGTLTVAGVEQPLTLTVERCDVTPNGFTVVVAARVDRTAFGVTAMPGLAARHLTMSAEVRCVRAGVKDRGEDRARARR
ncbi:MULTISPECIES: YceI family protein [unclassified Nonomuraea]|uniref:YceI family protein n=1 Tax=unclassified Nonomuraea TaxID=2593643 RepID=UPI0033DFFB06